MNLSNNKPHHGRGWSFPPRFEKLSAEVAMTEGEEDINRSLEIIVKTNMGERIMNPTFGCGLKNYVFDALNTSTLALMEDAIRNAVILHEARVDLVDVRFELNGGSGRIDIYIDYKMRSSNSRFNLVLPYYLKESNLM
jgi:uncharacterized protein